LCETAHTLTWRTFHCISMDKRSHFMYHGGMRYTIDFDPTFDKTLTDLVKSTDASTKAEVIRRAVASYSYLKKQQAQDSDVKVAIVDKNNNITKEIVLP
jgi:hypothetical protein